MRNPSGRKTLPRLKSMECLDAISACNNDNTIGRSGSKHSRNASAYAYPSLGRSTSMMNIDRASVRRVRSRRGLGSDFAMASGSVGPIRTQLVSEAPYVSNDRGTHEHSIFCCVFLE